MQRIDRRWISTQPTTWIVGAAVLGACGGGPNEPDEQSCLDPARGPAAARFADVTSRSGLDFKYTANDFKGAGLAVVDLDGDGRPEIVAGRRDGGLTLFRNRGSLHFEAIADAGIDPATAATAIGAVDLDNDGDRDLVVAGTGIAYVIANKGDGTFEVAAVFDNSGGTEHVLPVDLDGDGLLDLYFSNLDILDADKSMNRLYLNRGRLQFAVVGPAGAGLSWTATALDVDADGDQDLYVANDTLVTDYGKPMPATPPSMLPLDLLLRNDGPGADGIPRFTDVAAELGFANPRSSMGGLLGDFDGDGRLDIYIPNFGANKLLLRDPAGSFVDGTSRLGVAATARVNPLCPLEPKHEACLVLSWSAALSDFDLDGYDELLVVNGETSPLDPPPVMLFTRGPELAYRELSPGIPCMDARGLVVTDLDADGDQDVVIGQKEGALLIYENRGRPAAGTWLQVVLSGSASNRDGVGAVVTARMTSGRTLPRAIGAGGVVHSASPAEAWFGLGSDEVEVVQVQWPSGRRTELTGPLTGSLVLEEGP